MSIVLAIVPVAVLQAQVIQAQPVVALLLILLDQGPDLGQEDAKITGEGIVQGQVHRVHLHLLDREVAAPYPLQMVEEGLQPIQRKEFVIEEGGARHRL